MSESTMKFSNLNIRSNKPATFQSQTMRAQEYGGSGCAYLQVEVVGPTVYVHAVHSKDGKVMKTSIFNWADCAEIYGDRV